MNKSIKCSNCGTPMSVEYGDTIPIIKTCDSCKGIDSHYMSIIARLRDYNKVLMSRPDRISYWDLD